MKLHSSSVRPDWESLAASEQNAWQRLAVRTHGILTPANVLSIVGALLAFGGLGYLLVGRLAYGLGLLVIGRIVDAVDGAVADKTGTKSQVGEVLDASIDKCIAFLALIVFVAASFIPWWLAALIATQNAANALIALYGLQHRARVRPNRAGKLATAGYWIGLTLFIGAGLVIVPDAPVRIAAYVVTFAALGLGSIATFSYWQFARGNVAPTAAKKLFDTVLVIRNPVSSDAHKADQRIALLRRLLPGSELHILQTAAGGLKVNQALLRAHQNLLGPRTLLCIAAGDGTVHLILNSLLHDPELPDSAKQTPLLPLWCGNANDLAYMLNGAWSRMRLRNILNRGRIVRVRPLECTINDKHGERRFTASSYASFGATAYVAEELERVIPRRSPARRFIASRVGQEVFAAAHALAQAPTFTIIEHGRSSVIYERTYLKGSRFAKFIGLPLKLTEEKFHRNTIARKNPVVVLLHIIGLMLRYDAPRRAITHDTFTVQDTVWAQFDGEPLRVTGGSQIEIKLSEKPFYALSLRLHGTNRKHYS